MANFEILVRPGELLERAIRRAKKKFFREVRGDIKKHQHYTKPSAERNRLNNRRKRQKERAEKDKCRKY